MFWRYRRGILASFFLMCSFFCFSPVSSAEGIVSSCVNGGPCLPINNKLFWTKEEVLAEAAKSGGCATQPGTWEYAGDSVQVANTYASTWRYTTASGSCLGASYRHCHTVGWFILNGSCQAGTPPADVCKFPDTWDAATGTCKTPTIDCSKLRGTKASGTLQGSALPDGGFCAKTGQFVPNPNGGNDGLLEGTCEAVMSIVVSSGTGTSESGAYSYTYTGEACSTMDIPVTPPDPVTKEFPKNGCIRSASGQDVCVQSSKPNCGTVNGDPFCASDVPKGNCTFLPGGSWVCDVAAPSPPKPTVAPSANAKGRSSSGQPQAVQIFPTGAAGGDDQSTYTGAGGAGSGDKPCGGEGDPCKIDEEGTPTAGDADVAGAKGALDQALTDAQGESGNGPQGDGSGTASSARSALDSALPTPGDCGPLVMTLPGGRSYNIDLYDKCSDFRSGLAWMLGLSTAWFVLDLIFKRPG